MSIGYAEARTHALILAVIGWSAVTAFVVAGRGDRSAFGPLKWSDFVHFYTLGDMARGRDGVTLYDGPALHAAQVALVPASASDVFVPVYAPIAALIFAPFSALPYAEAGLLWALVSTAVYLWAVWLAWRAARGVLPDRTFVFAAALAFPPAFLLAAYGQSTAVIVLAFAAGWQALEADRRVLAGVALSLLTVKPQFGLVLAAVAAGAGEGRLVAGAVLGVLLQALAVLGVFGPEVFAAYAGELRRLPSIAPLLEPAAYKMHSLAVLTHLLPPRLDLIVWSAVSIAIVLATLAIWRSALPMRVRFGVLVLASALVNPHLTVYDATVLALPAIWIGSWLLAQRSDSRWFWQHTYWIGAAFLLPTALLFRVQLSPILMAALFVRIVREVTARHPIPIIGSRSEESRDSPGR